MADNKDKKVLNVPALRFPEFIKSWECSILEKLSKKIGDGIHSTPSYDDNGTFYFINGNNLNGGKIVITSSTKRVSEKEAYKNNAENLEANSILMSINGTIGNVALYHNEPIMLGKSACYINSKDNIDKNYLFYYLQYPKTQLYFEAELTGTTIKNLSLQSIRKTKIYIPTIEEQHKISRFLQKIDERISTQNKIIEDLKKLKSAIVEALFCAPKESVPAKRLSPYSKDWKLVKLFDICQRIQTKNTGRQCRQVLTIAAQYGLVNQEDFFNKTVASENLERYYLLQKGDFAYNKSYSGDYAWGAIKRLERYEQGVLSPLYICFRPNITKVDADYLAHYFESKKWHKGIADIAGEGARNHGLLNISVIDFFNTIHRIPDLEEQKVIAQFLNKFSSKLSCEQRIMQSLTKQRNYLLHKMFI